MSNLIDREGVFRAQIYEYGLQESSQSKAVMLGIKARISQAWNEDDPNNKHWDDWVPYDFEAHGNVVLIKKDESLNTGQVEALCRACGWDGSIGSIFKAEWQPTPCQIVVKHDDYEGKTRYRIAFINEYDRVPGSVGNITPEKAKDLHTRLGSQFRAIAGNVKRNAPATNGAATPGKPPPPPAPKAPPAAPKQPPMTSHEVPQPGDAWEGESVPY